MAGLLFFFSMLTSSSSLLLFSHLPCSIPPLHSISFLSGRSLLALCVGPFHLRGGQVAQGSYYPPPHTHTHTHRHTHTHTLWRVAREGNSVGERGIRRLRSAKDAVRYVRDSGSIYLVILGELPAPCTESKGRRF